MNMIIRVLAAVALAVTVSAAQAEWININVNGVITENAGGALNGVLDVGTPITYTITVDTDNPDANGATDAYLSTNSDQNYTDFIFLVPVSGTAAISSVGSTTWQSSGALDLEIALPGLFLDTVVSVDGVGMTPDQILPDFSSVSGGLITVDMGPLYPGAFVLADVSSVSFSEPADTDSDGTINALDSDDDNDGMPDDWELSYLFNPWDASNATEDPDGDGYTNLQEYQNNTDPTVFDAAPACASVSDFDCDGDDDVLMRNTVTGQNVVWLLEDGAKAGTSALTTNALTFEVAGILDGDGDGDADILWYDSVLGKLIFWQMQGGVKAANAFLGNTTATLNGVGDFDGDGDPDILLKTSLGAIKIWTLNNMAIALSTNIGTPGGTYQVIDTGDFNGDGIDDIVMQNAAGAVRIWQLNSSAQLDTTINVATISTAYSLKKSGDTDNDGDDDLVFRNDTTGQSLVWQMQNGARVDANVISSLNASMQLATVTDFDQDGDEDLMFRDSIAGNESDGDTIIWKMQDNVKQSNSFLGNNAVTFILESTLDMDGDGDSDILYRDNTTGQILGWNMEAGAKAGNYNLGPASTAWEVRF